MVERLTTSEAARWLKLSRSRVEHLLQEGRLWGIKWGRDWMINKDSLELYLQTKRSYVKASDTHAQNTNQDIQQGEPKNEQRGTNPKMGSCSN